MVSSELERMRTEKCGFRWQAWSKPQECIRLKGHEGNHVSYPSGAEYYNDPEDDAHAGIQASEHAERNRTSSND